MKMKDKKSEQKKKKEAHKKRLLEAKKSDVVRRPFLVLNLQSLKRLTSLSSARAK
jgi:hypothetical protein